MLRIILLSLFWGICGTCLVRPWFWRGLKNKNLFSDDGKIGFTRLRWKTEVVAEIALFIIICFISSFLLSGVSVKQNICIYFILISICCIFQMISYSEGMEKKFVVMTIGSIYMLFLIQDIYAVINIQIQTYSDDRYMYEISIENNEDGIIIINKNNYNEAYFIVTEYEFELNEIMNLYPTDKLIELQIAVSDDDTPYGVFVKANKTWLLGKYDVDSYILFNLITGETEEYLEGNLPEFVTNN